MFFALFSVYLLHAKKKKKQRKRRRAWLAKALESHNHQKIPLLFQEGYNYLKITTGEAALHKLPNLSPHYKASLYKAIYHTSASGEPLTTIQSKNHKKEKEKEKEKEEKRKEGRRGIAGEGRKPLLRARHLRTCPLVQFHQWVGLRKNTTPTMGGAREKHNSNEWQINESKRHPATIKQMSHNSSQIH